MTGVRRRLREVGAGSYPAWFVVAMIVAWIAITIIVGQALASTERVMFMRTGPLCSPYTCPPSMEVWPAYDIASHPAYDTGFVIGFLVVASVVVAWRWLGRLARDPTQTS
jgi:hypothetical protein